MIKHIKLNELCNFKLDNILLIIDQDGFVSLSQDEIFNNFNYNSLINIYWIFILGKEASKLEEKIDFIIEETSLKSNNEKILDIITTSYDFNNTEELLSDLFSCLENNKLKFNCLVASKKIQDLLTPSGQCF